MTLNKNNH